MDAIQLLLLSVLVFGVGALASLLLNGTSRTARYVSGIAGMLGSLVGLLAVILAIINKPATLELPLPLPFGHFYLQMDGLSTLMIGMIAVLGFVASLYSIFYLEQYDQRNLGVLGFFTNLFIAMMMLVVTVANAFYFLVFWEMMTVASYFLVIFESEKKEVIRAGYLYMLVAHAGGALIMVSFFLFFASAGSFDFAAFRQAQLSPALRNAIFLLAFIGFGAKAGMVPLHIWMPGAYTAAPSHVSALMASVMKKTAIYGILRVCVDLLGASVLWWGLLVLFFGALSAILGVLFALTERNLKRMLAYSSVENVGIILLGIGTGMMGLATQQAVVALLGFLAALYHALNHSFFKGLLFLGAGALDYRLHTRDLNEMGGLARRMPWTGLAFLIGALAVAAIPPFNGFVSEWFTYQAFFKASSDPNFVIRVVAPLSALLLSLAGALAAMLYIKAYGSAFSGPAHSQPASQAREVPGTMLTGMYILVAGCLALGLGAPLVAPYLMQVAAGLPGATAMTVANGVWVYPANINQATLSTPLSAAILSTPLIAILLLGLLIAPFVILAVYGGFKAGRRTVVDPWSCGYGYSPKMSVSASSFDQPMKATFRSLYALRPMIQKPLDATAAWSKRFREGIVRAEPLLESWVTRPTARAVQYLGEHIQALQMGDIRVYCLYIILTLAVLLIVIFK
jgi:hydrogenase-4 component B